MSFFKKYPDHTAAIVALLIGAALASIGSYGINPPEECWPLASTLAYPYHVLLDAGQAHLVDGQVDVWLWLEVWGLYFTLLFWPLWFLIMPSNGGGAGGTSGGRRIVP